MLDYDNSNRSLTVIRSIQNMNVSHIGRSREFVDMVGIGVDEVAKQRLDTLRDTITYVCHLLLNL